LDRCFFAVTVLMAWIACIETVLTAFRGQAAAKKCLRMSQRDTFKAMVEAMFKGAATAKGALSITPEKVIVTTPGADKKRAVIGK